MHSPSVPHQQQDCQERRAEHGTNSTVAGWYNESSIKPYFGPSFLLSGVQPRCWTRQQTFTDEAHRRGEQAMREAFTDRHATNGPRIRAQNTRGFRVLLG